MEIKEQLKLKFRGIDIPHVNFTSIKLYSKESEKIKIVLHPKVFYPKEKTRFFRIIMDLTIEAENFFSLKVVAIGTFEVDKELIGDIKKNFINVNAPAIMFPYLRSFVSTFTANIGNLTGTLNIPPQFFKGELEEINSDNIDDEDVENAL
ncbi:MAG: protein-export chaperone SecB [Lewinellaceae bacterium]|nr:protein-export chaperone SecB [Lewinellaceae bacterium]